MEANDEWVAFGAPSWSVEELQQNLLPDWIQPRSEMVPAWINETRHGTKVNTLLQSGS